MCCCQTAVHALCSELWPFLGCASGISILCPRSAMSGTDREDGGTSRAADGARADDAGERSVYAFAMRCPILA
eukprot:2089572-Rhodomonas_salina.2